MEIKIMKKLCLAMIVFILLLMNGAKAGTKLEFYEFLSVIRVHRLNVLRVGSRVIDQVLTHDNLVRYLAVYEDMGSNKTDFRKLRAKFKKKLSLHDVSKEMNWISEDMYWAHGGPIPKHVVENINTFDKKVADAFDIAHQMLPWQVRLFNVIELMVDLVERELNPMTQIEFGREVVRADHKLKELADHFPDGNFYEKAFLIDQDFEIQAKARDLYDSHAIDWKRSHFGLAKTIKNERHNHYAFFIRAALRAL